MKFLIISLLLTLINGFAITNQFQNPFFIKPYNYETIFAQNFPEFYEKYQNNHKLNEIFNLHKDLIDIQSISKNEEKIFDYLHHFLISNGFQIEIVENKNEINRKNIYAYRTKQNHHKLLLTTHIDTVPPYIPYFFNETSGEIKGRGVNDAKGSIVGQLISILELIEENSINNEDISLLFVVGEEIDGDGMANVVEYFTKKNYSWNSVVFGEPTENKLGKGHKGNYMFDLQVQGKASHSGYPELGISANEIIIAVLHDLMLETYPVSDILGPTTFNIGKLQGGIAANVIPAHSSAQVFYRIANDLNKVDDIVKSVINNHNIQLKKQYKLDYDLIKIKNLSTKEPQYLDYEVEGFENIVLSYATDIPGFKIDVDYRYLYGPGSILSAHGDNEFIMIEDLMESVEGYKKLVKYNLELLK